MSQAKSYSGKIAVITDAAFSNAANNKSYASKAQKNSKALLISDPKIEEVKIQNGGKKAVLPIGQAFIVNKKQINNNDGAAAM